MSEPASHDPSQVPGRANDGVTSNGGSKGVRNMADVARMFLDGARPLPNNGAAAPKRLGPNERVPAQPIKIEEKTQSRAAAASKEASRSALPSVLFGMCGGGGGGEKNWKLLCGAAEALATEHATTVCVIGERNGVGELVMELIGVESESDVPRLAPGAGSADLQVGRAMYSLRESVGAWLIAAPETACEAFGKGLHSIADWLVVASTTNAGIVGVYQQMKRALAVTPPAKAMGAFIVGEDEKQAKGVFGRLEQAAREFLKQQLFLMGVGPESNGGVKAAGISMGQEERSGVWAAVFDELCGVDVEQEEIQEMDVETALEKVAAASKQLESNSQSVTAASHAVFDQLSHVLDPEEREALSAELEELPAEAFDIRQEVVAPSEPSSVPEDRIGEVNPVVAPMPTRADRIEAEVAALKMETGDQATTLEGPQGMRVFDLPNERSRTRALEWDAVEASVPELMPGSILLEARPPMSWATECCLAIDVQHGGQLHIWTLYKNGVSWFGLREWAAEHRRILALTRRDLVMDQTGEVVVHIVMPLEMEEGDKGSAGTVRDLLRTPCESVHVYRIRMIAWGPRRGMVVIPMV